MILFAYPSIFFLEGKKLQGCAWFFITHVVRQTGHFFYEHQDRDIEKVSTHTSVCVQLTLWETQLACSTCLLCTTSQVCLLVLTHSLFLFQLVTIPIKLKFGHKDASKKEAVAFLSFASVAFTYRDELVDILTPFVHPRFLELSLEQYVCAIAMFTVVPHFVEIIYQYGYLRGLSWAVKIVTDPFTDLLDFYTHVIINPKWFLDTKELRAVYRLNIKTKEVVKVD